MHRNSKKIPGNSDFGAEVAGSNPTPDFPFFPAKAEAVRKVFKR